jgi:hypothetical protein
MNKTTLNNMNHAQLLAVAYNICADIGILSNVPLISKHMLRGAILRKMSHDIITGCIDRPNKKDKS